MTDNMALLWVIAGLVVTSLHILFKPEDVSDFEAEQDSKYLDEVEMMGVSSGAVFAVAWLVVILLWPIPVAFGLARVLSGRPFYKTLEELQE